MKNYIKILLALLFMVSNFNLQAQANFIERSSATALDAVLNFNENSWQNLMRTKDSLFVNFYEKYTLDNINSLKLKEKFKTSYKNGLESKRQTNFLEVYNELTDKLDGDLRDYQIEEVIQKQYTDNRNRYERVFDLIYFASIVVLKNNKTGKQFLIVSNMVFMETIRTVGLEPVEWYKNLGLQSYRVSRVIPKIENTELNFVLDKFIRDKKKQPQAADAVGNTPMLNKEDLVIRYFTETESNIILKETFNKKNRLTDYEILIKNKKSQYQETIVQHNYLAFMDSNRMMYLDKKRNGFKGFYIKSNGEKQEVRFKLKK